MQSSNGPDDESTDGQRTPTQSSMGQEPAASSRHPMSPPSPKGVRPESKPKFARRTSSKHPHKGQEFSVDDDPAEYESDIAQRRASLGGKSTAHGVRKAPTALRRRPTHKPSMPRIDSKDEDVQEVPQKSSAASVNEGPAAEEESSDTANADNEEEDDDSLSDAESFTLKDKQTAINQTHPFGIRIWKPALYKKNRSVEKTAEGDIHSSPGARVSRWLAIFNLLWTFLFGWWLALAAALGALVCFLCAVCPEAPDYGRVFLGLSGYLLFPFGKFVKLEQDEAYADEDEGEGRSISEYEQWQQGDLEDGRLFFGPISRSIIGRRRSAGSDETESLLGRTRRGAAERIRDRRARLFGRGQWTAGRVIFFMFFYFLIAPLMLLSSLICWFLVFWIPMGRATALLFYHLRRHPLALSFHSDASYSRGRSARPSSILLCTYRAVGLKYWKYTVDGTNIFLINLLGVVLFSIFDYFVLYEALEIHNWLTNPFLVFALSLFSIIPLAYFIGQAVASISAQSSMGVGAAINAFFSTVVEVFLYCVALNQGKGQLVEGSIIGSIFAGILFLPGLSMCFGALKRKTQRFNVRSAGVTSTMLLFATIAAFGPTLFYQIYGSHELNCHSCELFNHAAVEEDEDCRRCYYTQTASVSDEFFVRSVRPYCWFAAVLLFLSYVIGLWFTLRTHAAVIWNAEVEEKKALQTPALNGAVGESAMHASGTLPSRAHTSSIGNKDVSRNREASIRESQLYRRILSQTLKQDGLALRSPQEATHPSGQPGHLVPPKTADADNATLTPDSPHHKPLKVPGMSEEDSNYLIRHVAEMAATAAAAAARDATRPPRDRKPSIHHTTPKPNQAATFNNEEHEAGAATAEAPVAAGGHDAPNWGRTKSAVILLGATVLYAVIAEILVNTVDSVLTSIEIDEKFLGITLFALVPNTTEFLNAISFAMNGNIALSMEIGSAYALQVFLLQIPALVLFSALHSPYFNGSAAELADHTFSLIFPQWDMVTVILCVFLLSYVYGEGKSNYFKGSILCLTYFVIVVGFYLAGMQATGEIEAIRRFGDSSKFMTIGRGRSGRAY